VSQYFKKSGLKIGFPKVRGANFKKSGLNIGSPKVRGANISINLD
jgi:hypothetical protein